MTPKIKLLTSRPSFVDEGWMDNGCLPAIPTYNERLSRLKADLEAERLSQEEVIAIHGRISKIIKSVRISDARHGFALDILTLLIRNGK